MPFLMAVIRILRTQHEVLLVSRPGADMVELGMLAIPWRMVP